MPAESNRIWMAGKPLGDWLGTTSGQRLCCAPTQVGCCGYKLSCERPGRETLNWTIFGLTARRPPNAQVNVAATKLESQSRSLI